VEEIRQFKKRYCSGAIINGLIAGTGLIIFGFKSFGKGIILGTLFSILNFILLNEMISMKLGVTQAKLILLAICSACFRYIILAFPLILSIKMEQFNFIAVIFGIFAVQIVILVDTLFVQPPKRQA